MGRDDGSRGSEAQAEKTAEKCRAISCRPGAFLPYNLVIMKPPKGGDAPTEPFVITGLENPIIKPLKKSVL